MKLWEKILYVSLLVIILLFSVMNYVSAFDLGNVTLQQQNDVCEVLNLTYIDCYDLWQIVSDYNETTCDVCNYSNYTLTSECFNETDCTNCSDDLGELEKIDEYQKRGFEPVFENGIIVNFQKARNESCEAYDCSKQCEEAVSSVYAQFENRSDEEKEKEPSNMPYFIFAFLIFALVIGLIAIKKFRMFSPKIPPHIQYGESPPSPPLPNPSAHEFSIPEPPKPDTSSLQESVDKLSESSGGG